jgi:hypothetical protein
MRRHLPALLLAGLLLAATAAARTTYVPLDPASLGGAAVFTGAEDLVARAARQAGLEFLSDPRPLLPHVLLVLDTAEGEVARKGGLVFWRGDMLPDQLAPGETGTLVRKIRQADGRWKTTRTRKGVPPTARPDLVAAVRTTASFTLPSMIIETAYQLGTAGSTPATLVLWRSVEEGSAPLGGAIALPNPPSGLAEALQSLAPDFAGRADWLAEFQAFSP